MTGGPAPRRVTVGVLGRTAATVDGERVPLGAAGQRAVLARLVVAGRHVVSTDRLVDDLWNGEPPPRAQAALQVHVSNLRRALEPDRAPRAPATVLISSPPGYALDLPTDAVDAWRFERLIADATAEQDLAVRTALLTTALKLYTGPPYQEVAETEWAGPEITRLEELRSTAVEQWAAATMPTAGPVAAIADLQRLVQENPGREEAVRLLALAQYRSGRQAEALAVLRRARGYLADELGIDPGPALRALETDVLAQNPALDAVPGPPPPARPPASAAPVRGRTRTAAPSNGRPAELAALLDTAQTAAVDGLRVVWIGGDAGEGKSTLARLLSGTLEKRSCHVAWGHCPEVDGGAPPGWPWAEVVRALAERIAPDAETANRLRPLLHEGPPAELESVQPFWLSRWLAQYLVQVAGDAPTLIVLDDAHRADALTLQLLRQLAEYLVDSPVLIVATFRPAEVGADLTATWAAMAALQTERIGLGGLDRAGVRMLAAEHGLRHLDAGTLDLLLDRTNGNPLFVRELSRLIVAEGIGPAREAVPAGIGDVLRRRLSRLPDATVTALRAAAVLGRDVDLEVLAAVVDRPEDELYDALEPAVLAGLLTEPAIATVRFTHALVRDTLYNDLSRLRRARLHATALQVLAASRPDDTAALARHAAVSATPSSAEQATGYIVAAARDALALHSYREARNLWQSALSSYEISSSATDLGRFEILVPLVAASARIGDVLGARAVRRDAVQLAQALGRRDLLIRALTSWRTPVIWGIRLEYERDSVILDPLERLLADPDLDDADRCLLGVTLVFELEGIEEARAIEMCTESVELARKLDDPTLLCPAIGALGYLAYGPDLRAVRLALADELLSIATEHGYDDYRALAHYQLFMYANAHVDLDGARRHLADALGLATGSQLGQLLAVGALYAGLVDIYAGRLETAAGRFHAVAAMLTQLGTVHGELIAVIGDMGVAARTGDFGALADELGRVEVGFGDSIRGARSLALFDAGRVEQARALWARADPYRRDYYWLAMTTLRGLAAARLGDLDACREVLAQLTPFSGTVAADSGSLYAGPVDSALAAMHDALGDHETARRLHAAGEALTARLADLVADPAWFAPVSS